ncbi:hypothetical protein [Armatimonas sp.]|uniref:hypothetical protein n=1 Tax=Armatimonas sp. TaxID=1872638 RepID=UPI00286B3238|nr:hypothetical protein [Armatimonas sp.]
MTLMMAIVPFTWTMNVPQARMENHPRPEGTRGPLAASSCLVGKMGDLVEFLPPKARREAPQSPTISVEAISIM